jgi:hypothetical protein
MKRWSILALIAIFALLIPLSTAGVSAQDELSLSKSADTTSAAVGDTINYTYTITNTDNVTIENIYLEDKPLGIIDLGGQTSLGAGENISATATYTVVEADLPGPLVNTATVSGADLYGNVFTDNDSATVELSHNSEIQVNKVADRETASPREVITYTYTITNTGNMAIENIILEDNMLGPISLGSNGNMMLAPGQSVSANATYTVSIWDFLRGMTIVNTANASGNDSLGNSLTGSDTATVSLTIISKALLTKFEILKLSGVPGKGIEKAPGLQKPFNPNSQAAEHAGKKGNPEMPEQLQAQESVENQGTEQQLRITSEVQNQAGSTQATQNDDARPQKWQLKKNWSSDNQTQLQESIQGNGKNKPDKDKPNKKPKQGK